MRAMSVIMSVLIAASPCPAGPSVPAGMKRVEGKYHYLIHDLTDPEARELLMRMQAMVEEYESRTRDFSGRIGSKLPFMVFRERADYLRAGGLEGTDGVFKGDVLMAVVGQKLDSRVWHVIQHEGFHQFAAAVIGGNRPAWLNEGLAEYFGEAVYTGDGFVSGAMPRFRLQRIQQAIEQGRFKPFREMLILTLEQWNDKLTAENYDQAWAMVQFLAHGDDDRYRAAFGRYIARVSRGGDSSRVFGDEFGDPERVEARFTAWWKGLEPTASRPVYTRAATQMLGSYLARATAFRQDAATIDDLLKLIEANEVRAHREDVLPATLGAECSQLVRGLMKAGAEFQIKRPPDQPGRKQQPMIECRLNGLGFVAKFQIRDGNRVASVQTQTLEQKAP